MIGGWPCCYATRQHLWNRNTEYSACEYSVKIAFLTLLGSSQTEGLKSAESSKKYLEIHYDVHLAMRSAMSENGTPRPSSRIADRLSQEWGRRNKVSG